MKNVTYASAVRGWRIIGTLSYRNRLTTLRCNNKVLGLTHALGSFLQYRAVGCAASVLFSKSPPISPPHIRYETVTSCQFLSSTYCTRNPSRLAFNRGFKNRCNFARKFTSRRLRLAEIELAEDGYRFSILAFKRVSKARYCKKFFILPSLSR